MPKAALAKRGHRAKSLQVQRQHLINRIARMERDKHCNKRRLDQARGDLQALEEKIESRERNGPLTMSEHAMLRYLERVEGLDLDAVCQAVVTPGLLTAVDALGDGKYPIGDGKHRALVVNKQIVTILEG